MFLRKSSRFFLLLAFLSLFAGGCLENQEAQEQAELIEFEIKDHINCQEFASAKNMVLENYQNNQEKFELYTKLIEAKANSLACTSLKVEKFDKIIKDKKISFYGKIKNTTNYPIEGFRLVLRFYDIKQNLLSSDFIDITPNKLGAEAVEEFEISSDKYIDYANCYYNVELVDAFFPDLPNIPDYR